MTARAAVSLCRVVFISAMTGEDAASFDAVLRGELTPVELEEAGAQRERRAAVVRMAGGDVIEEED